MEAWRSRNAAAKSSSAAIGNLYFPTISLRSCRLPAILFPGFRFVILFPGFRFAHSLSRFPVSGLSSSFPVPGFRIDILFPGFRISGLISSFPVSKLAGNALILYNLYAKPLFLADTGICCKITGIPGVLNSYK